MTGPAGVPAHPDTSDAALRRVTDALAANAERYDRSAEFPWESIHAVHEAGLLTLGIGPAYGGRELSATEAARVLQALGQGDPSVALLTAMTVFQHVSQARLPRWPEALYRQVVSDSRQRPVLINAVRAEPEWGAPARGGLPATKLTRTARGWLLNGHKGYGTGSEGLAYHLVWAVTEDDEPLIGHVIVPGDSPGIKVVRTWDHLGLRASSTHDIVYTDVEVPFENFPGVPVAEAGRDAAAFASVGTPAGCSAPRLPDDSKHGTVQYERVLVLSPLISVRQAGAGGGPRWCRRRRRGGGGRSRTAPRARPGWPGTK